MNSSCTTLVELRDALAKGAVSPSAAVESSLARIVATEPDIHACVMVCADEARAAAAALENAPRPAPGEKPLWGVPVTLKDVFCTKNLRTTCASRMLENFVPPYDADAVERLKKAGAVVVAKTNMDEFAMGTATAFSVFGPSRNPRDTGRVPGGSSGGSAASVTAGQAFGSLGSDSGGSIRQPAALCGCVGMKPTYGRVSRYGAVACASSFDQVGPLGRSVADCALLLSIVAGFDPKDATCADLPVPDYSAALKDRKDLAGLTLGLPKEYWAQELAPEVRKACAAAVDLARDLGATVKDVSLPHMPYGSAAYAVLTTAEAGTNLARFDGLRFGLQKGEEDGLLAVYTQTRAQGFGEEVKLRILLGTWFLSAGQYDSYYTQAARVRRLIAQDFRVALAECDALLAPTCPVTAWKADATSRAGAACKTDLLTQGMNLAGLPGLSLPVGAGEESGLPVGLHIMGRAFDEAGILQIGNALEAALPRLPLL